ncbi:hypothetical protein MNAN1_003407 [Malassezia nana]|uniref:CN hydrolase domain-containing protein n=1 Tax=Malassezia nana TaxID=180528 RepID=A0AAF0ETZ3_9BASI|nr:hypothetical protein MNAN1_003407 [Malassezia nana]
MRVACVQYAPALGRVADNAERVRTLTASLQSGQVDLLVLPEMALTGYVFDSLEEIAPLLEDPYGGQGATLDLAVELARRVQCHVVAGFPERASPRALAELGTPGQHDARVAREEVTGLTHLPRVERQAFNAAMLVAPDGSLVKVFRKHFLYETDTTWADEGGGFEYVDIPGLGRLCVAICMDLNPYTLESEFSRYELASYCEQYRIDYLVVPMNWLLPEEEVNTYETSNAQDASLSTINYWVARCMPLWMPGLCEPGHEGRTTYLIACNRTGIEQV